MKIENRLVDLKGWKVEEKGRYIYKEVARGRSLGDGMVLS